MPTVIVYPSGAARATRPVPMLPVAPPTFSMMMVWDADGKGRVANDRHPLDSLCDLFEQVQPFYAHAVIDKHESSGVAARPGQTRDVTSADRVSNVYEYDRYRVCRLQQRRRCGAACRQQDVRRRRNQLPGVSPRVRHIAGTPTDIYLDVAVSGPAQLLESVQERGEAGLPFRIVRESHEDADAPYLFRLLRALRAAIPPRCRRAE